MTLYSVSIALGQVRPLGVSTDFIPCRSAFSGCLGKARLTMARASSPLVVLAESDEFELVAPSPVGSPAVCQARANIVHLDGDQGDPVHPGTETFTVGTFDSVRTFSDSGRGIDIVRFEYEPQKSISEHWYFDFFTAGIREAMGVRVYDGASSRDGLPWFSVLGPNSTLCIDPSGSYQVHTIAFDARAELKEMLVTFERKCSNTTSMLRGCIHFAR
jgi:hypothetical protein